MPPARKRRRGMTEEDPMETQDPGDAQWHRIVEEDFSSSSSSTCSSSFPSSFSSSIISSSSSLFSLFADISEVEAAAGTISLPQPPLGICPSLMSESQEGYPSSQEEAPSTSSQALLGAEFLPRNAIDDKVGELVEFLFLKYRNKELTTRAEILRTVLTDCQELFPVILSQACECMQLIFGIDVQEVDLQVHSYVLTNTLGLTYNDTLSSEQKLPNGGLLIFILTKIFIEGNRAPEEGIWESLSMMGVHPGKEHFIFGEPRKLLTKVWVQEQYLEYLQVPGSHPACYEFLWGPRAYAETSKMEVLEFFARISDSNPRSFEVWYEEALREQEERAHARLSTTDDTPAMACTDTNAMTSAGFSV